MTEEGKDLVPASTPAETALDVIALVTSIAPWIGSPVSLVLSGMSVNRKLGRIREVLKGVAEELKDFKSEASEAYVKTEEFEELLERTLRQAADERDEEKRRIYKNFLIGAIESPGEPYDEQIRFLRTIEEIQPDHIKVLRAMNQEPPAEPTFYMGAPASVLHNRLPDIPEDRLKDLVSQLNDLRITSAGSLNTLMSGHGAENLRSFITPYGQRFLRFLVD